MRGFESDFTDLPDYILKITERIWERRGIDLIRRYYTPDCIVRTPGGIIRGAGAVVQSTLETLHQFPDRRLHGEDVVWSGDDDQGYYSSHRILSTMHHLGDGNFGTATGKPVRVRTIADCAVRDNQVYEEWMVRDQAAIAKQVGLEPRELAAVLLEQAHRHSAPTPEQEVPAIYTGEIDDSAEASRYADCWRSIWDNAQLSAIAETYTDAAALQLPVGRSATGHGGMDRFCLGYLAAFPGAQFSFDHLIVRRDAGQPIRIAARWSITASHSGHGAFGKPTGAPVSILGISHAQIVDGKVVAEWILVDELAVWQQILKAGEAPT